MRKEGLALKKLIFKPIYFAAIAALLSLVFVIEALASRHLSYILPFVGYGGTFKPHDLKIFGLPAYPWLIALGFVLCVIISLQKRKMYALKLSEALIYPAVFLLGSLVGGKVLYIIENFEIIKTNGMTVGGLSLFGAIFAVPMFFLLLSVIFKRKYSEISDFCTPFGLILLSFTRLGCFISGCCGGLTYWMGTNPIILPIQLFEVVFDLVILEICLYAEKKHFKQGSMYPLLMLLYGTVRFFLEFLRKGGKVLAVFSLSQGFALISLIIGGALLFVLKRKLKK